METTEILKKIAIGVIALLIINGIIGFVSWFNNNRLGQALNKLETANEQIVKLQSELDKANDGVEKMKYQLSLQMDLIKVLDEEVEINYDQFKARLDQPTMEKRLEKLNELNKRLNKLREDKKQIDLKLK